jgi:DNA-binding CsgD family transcriptional regulator
MPFPSAHVREASQVMRAVLEIAETPTSVGDRRRDVLDRLAKLLQADAGHWAWGRGRPETATILPVAVIHFGYSEADLSAFYRFGLDSRLRDEFNLPLLGLMREDNVSCAVRRDLVRDQQWNADNWIFRQLRSMGKDSWLHCVRYAANDTWSNMFLVRDVGRPEFGPAERALLDLAITSIPWLWAKPVEDDSRQATSQTLVEGLSPRQRAVMFLVLDGLSRKKIAARLGISEETVNHHMKGVFQRFGVQSATELAALFLRSR